MSPGFYTLVAGELRHYGCYSTGVRLKEFILRLAMPWQFFPLFPASKLNGFRLLKVLEDGRRRRT